MTLNWDNIKIFSAIARQGSLTAAASELGVNHSTVLRRINCLEADLGVALFHRVPSGYTLTDAGERILRQTTKMEEQVVSLKREAVAADEISQSSIRVATPPESFLDLVPILCAYQEQHPGICLEVEAMDELRNLDVMGADVAIRFTNEPPDHYVGKKALELPFYLYASKDYLATHPDIEKVTDVDWVLLHVEKIGDLATEWLRSIDPGVNIVMKHNSAAMLIQALEAGAGVGFAPKHLADESSHLLKLDFLPHQGTFGLWLLTHSDLRYQPRIKNFLAFVLAALEKRYSEYAVPRQSIST